MSEESGLSKKFLTISKIILLIVILISIRKCNDREETIEKEKQIAQAIIDEKQLKQKLTHILSLPRAYRFNLSVSQGLKQDFLEPHIDIGLVTYVINNNGEWETPSFNDNIMEEYFVEKYDFWEWNLEEKEEVAPSSLIQQNYAINKAIEFAKTEIHRLNAIIQPSKQEKLYLEALTEAVSNDFFVEEYINKIEQSKRVAIKYPLTRAIRPYYSDSNN